MLDSAKITEIAVKVARTWVAAANLERVVTKPATDSEGKDALRITLVLTPEAARDMTGDEALDVLVGIQQGLWDAGEERLPIVEYATEEELGQADADLDQDDG